MEAAAHSLNQLEQHDLVDLNPSADNTPSNRAIIAAGTGLGEAGLCWNGREHEPFACEGGHADFSPRNELEIQLLRFLLRRFGHASWERVLSGPGLVNIYRFLCECEPLARNELVAAEMMNHDGAAVICQAALEHSCPVCERSLDVFVSLYAAEAGNLALKVMATGGLYIGGGIAPKIIDRLRQPAFLDSFAAKGRLQPVLERIPIRVIMTDRAAFFGAARYALKQRARHEGDDLASDRVARRGRHTVGTG